MRSHIKSLSKSMTGLIAGAMIYVMTGVASPVPAEAATKLILETDRAKIVRLAGTPATVIIGNPLYASIAVKGNMLIIQGKHFGSTNVIIMDEDGNTLAEMDLTVVADKKAEYLTVYRRGAQESYDCTQTCEAYVRVGDNNEFLNNINTQITTKTTSATGE